MTRSPLARAVTVTAIALAVPSAAFARPILAGEASHGAGEILVHYATTGGDAPPADDANTNAVPDFVEEVATTADAALASLRALGFRRPLDDGTLGGDGRIDIYLRDLVSADGNAATDSCAGATCVGHIAAENDYAGYAYASRTEAIRSVVPHELFHLIQDAYAADQASTWTEGTAVWAVEQLYADGNGDFERFLPAFLTKTFRPFERAIAGFSDGYPYGAALWPYFLAHRYDAALIVDAWERCGELPFLRALDAALAARGGSLDDAWREFTRWNGATGAHLVDGGYPAAAAWPDAPREPLLTDAATIYVEGRSARYVPVQLTEPRALVVEPTGGIEVAAWIAPRGAALADGIELDATQVLAPGDYALVVTGLSENTITTAVNLATAAPLDDGGCTTAPGAGLLIGLVAVLACRRRRLAASLAVLTAGATAFAEPSSSDAELTKLAQQQADDGEVIVVTGTRSETPRAASPVTTEVIDRKRIEESGVQTVSEALALRPGVWIDRGVSGAPGVSLQGLSPQYTLILVDGARQIGRTDGVLDLDRFSMQDIERIEIVRGPSSVLYGSDALGGVINIVTRPPARGIGADMLLRVDSRLGREARGRVVGGRGKLAGSIVGAYRDAKPVRIGDDGTQVATSIDGYDDAHVTAHGTYKESSTVRIDATGDYLQRDLRGIDAQATGAVFDRRNLVESALAGISATYAGERTAVRIEANGSFYRDQYLLDQRMSTALDEYQITDETLLETRAQAAHQWQRHRALAGTELLRETLETQRISTKGERTRAAVFVQDEWKLGDAYQILVVPAARVDYDSQFGSHVTPRLAARWQLADDTVVRGSIGMGYRAPSFKDLYLLFANPGVGYVVEGNPDLGPETSYSAQLGAEARPRPWLWLGADAYWNELRDMILAVTLSSDMPDMLRFSYDNIGSARTAGGDANVVFARGRAGLELGYALNLTRDRDQGRAIEGLPKHRVTATVRWRDQAEGFEAFVAGVVTGARPYYLSEDPLAATYTDARFELRARVSKRFRSGLGGFLGCDNILNAGDASLDRIVPRTLYVGMEASL